MMIVINDIVDRATVADLLDVLICLPFEDGRSTAGWSASLVKANNQACADPAIDLWRDRLAATFLRSPLFHLAAQPKRIIGPMFSRYDIGSAYGAHVDEPIIDGSRADLSYTLFLSDPDAYDGGELTIDTPAGSEAHKHSAGCLVLYPATTLHLVSPVTRGTRYAAVGWVRSHIRDATQRELLFDLETARRLLFEQHGKTHEVDLLSKCFANLIRMWADD